MPNNMLGSTVVAANQPANGSSSSSAVPVPTIPAVRTAFVYAASRHGLTNLTPWISMTEAQRNAWQNLQEWVDTDAGTTAATPAAGVDAIAERLLQMDKPARDRVYKLLYNSGCRIF